MQSPSLLWFELLAVLVEVLLFGAFCILYPAAIWILVHRKHRGRYSRSPVLWLSAIVTTMFLCAGADLTIDIRMLLLAFVDHSTTPGGPTAYFNNPGNNPALYVSAVIFAFLTLLGDGFMAYRVFVVWGGRPISLILPGLFLIGDIVTTAVFGRALLQGGQTTASDVIYIPGARAALIAYFLMTLLTNFGTTFLLLGRLYWHDRRTRRTLSQDVYDTVPWRVMKTIAQSQAVYSIGVIINLVTYLANSDLVLVTNSILPPLIGISFTLIITRIGLSEVVGNTSHAESVVSRPMEFNIPGHALSHDSTVNVFISRSDDRSEDVAVGRSSHKGSRLKELQY
ncbi:hypothetical protein VTO73DRAFT_4205 [Trametes versicolor]